MFVTPLFVAAVRKRPGGMTFIGRAYSDPFSIKLIAEQPGIFRPVFVVKALSAYHVRHCGRLAEHHQGFPRRILSSNGAKIPALALTAFFLRSEDRTRAMLAGYQVLIAKPIEPQELVATVGSLAGRMGGR